VGKEKEAVADPEGFFDEALLGELEELVASVAGGPSHGGAGTLPEKLAVFLADGDRRLDEDRFLALSPDALTDRINQLTEICRESGRIEAVQAVEGFIVFFRTLLPTLGDLGTQAVKRVFFRLGPTLIQIAFHDFGDTRALREEGREALRSLERVLFEIASVRLAPVESDLVFRSIDQLVHFIEAAEYAMASELISSQLLSLIARNRLARVLYHLMGVEVAVQRYLADRLGMTTPRFRLPDDAAQLGDYGPLRILEETSADGLRRRFIQVHLPDIPTLKDVVLHLVDEQSGRDHALRLDRLGSAELHVPDGAYKLGLGYEPA
jgi:hypothetical protein